LPTALVHRDLRVQAQYRREIGDFQGAAEAELLAWSTDKLSDLDASELAQMWRTPSDLISPMNR